MQNNNVKQNSKRNMPIDKKTTCLEIVMAIFIVSVDCLLTPFKKIFKTKKVQNVEEILDVQETTEVLEMQKVTNIIEDVPNMADIWQIVEMPKSEMENIQIIEQQNAEEISNAEEIQPIEEIPEVEEIIKVEKASKIREHFRLPILLKRRLAFAYILIAAFITVGSIYAFFSDRAIAQVDFQAGTILVKLVEEDPFDDLGSIPPAGANTNEKTFKAESVCSIDTYVRAKIIPVIEKYDEEEDGYVVIPIDVKDINLNVNAPDWEFSNGYYYYKNILEPDAKSEEVIVTVVGINNTGDFEDMNVRVTLRVELEAAPARNDVWKSIFNIEELPI